MDIRARTKLKQRSHEIQGWKMSTNTAPTSWGRPGCSPTMVCQRRMARPRARASRTATWSAGLAFTAPSSSQVTSDLVKASDQLVLSHLSNFSPIPGLHLQTKHYSIDRQEWRGSGLCCESSGCAQGPGPVPVLIIVQGIDINITLKYLFIVSNWIILTLFVEGLSNGGCVP